MSLEEVGSVLAQAKPRPPNGSDPSIDGMKPSLVFEPTSVEAAAEALAFCERESLAVAPVGAATRIHVGNLPARLDCFLSTAEWTGVDAYEPADSTVTVRSGTPLGRLDETLRQQGQFLPWDPPLAERATVGGVLASGEPGLRRIPGARPRDLVLGLEAVLADGARFKTGGRVVKNVAGYETTKLLCGSWGTLAVILRAHLRVRPVPEIQQTLAVSFDDRSELVAALDALGRNALFPEVLALVDPVLAASNGLKGWNLLLRLEGLEEEVAVSRRKCELAVGRPKDLTPLTDEAGHRLWQQLRDFPDARSAGVGDSMVVLGQILPSHTVQLAARWHGRGPMVCYPEGGRIYTTSEDPDDYARLFAEARALGGNAVLEAGPQALKVEVDVFGETPDGFPLMKAIKAKLDPKSTLSPGRFVGRL